jgi:hypothetical protein
MRISGIRGGTGIIDDFSHIQFFSVDLLYLVRLMMLCLLLDDETFLFVLLLYLGHVDHLLTRLHLHLLLHQFLRRKGL